MTDGEFIDLLNEGRRQLANSAHFADARLERIRGTRVACDENGCFVRRDRLQQGIGLRTYVNGRWGFVAVEGDLADVCWRKLLHDAETMARAIPANLDHSLAPMTALNIVDIPENIGQFIDVVDYMRQIIRVARDMIPEASTIRLQAVAEFGLRGVANSEGTLAIRTLVRSSITLNTHVRLQHGPLVSFPISVAGATSEVGNLMPALLNRLNAAQELG